MRFRYWTIAGLMLALATSPALAQQKTIKNPAEYNAYIAALNLSNPAQKAAAMMKFVAQYPNSVVKEDALAEAMAAYQASGNQAAIESVALRLLAINKNNVRALAIVTYFERARATKGDKKTLSEMETYAHNGLSAMPNWQIPAGMSSDDFTKIRGQTYVILYGAAGFAALQKKDYANARNAYKIAVNIDPHDLLNVYQLAVAELQMSPLDPMGFWHIARAAAIAKSQNNSAGTNQMLDYGRPKFNNYHRVSCNFDIILAQAEKTENPPADFAKIVTPVESPAAAAVQAVKECNLGEMSFDDWKYVLGYRDASPANKDAASKVWAQIQSLQKNGSAKIRMQVHVVAASTTAVEAAFGDDAKKANTADLRIAMAKPLTQPPAPGSIVEIRGVFGDYQIDPFLFLLKDGEIVVPK